MKRLYFTIITILLLLIPASATVSAYSPFSDACTAANNASSACATDGSDPVSGPHGFIRKASNIIAGIAGIAAVIIMMIGGLQYITSNGDAQKTANARNAIIGAAIGLGIIVAAQGIIILVLSKLQ